MIADLSDDRGASLAAELGSNVIYVRTDATDEASVLAALDHAAIARPKRARSGSRAAPRNRVAIARGMLAAVIGAFIT